MRDFLFGIVSHSNLFVLDVIKKTAELLAIINGRIGWFLLKVIDEDRMHHAEIAIEQQQEISELNVLFTIQQVRNNAVKIGKWIDDHENQLNFLGNVLANEYDWEVSEVERYLHAVIATGPALAKEE